MSNSHPAYSSPAQAGERRTVRHVIGGLRPFDTETSKMTGASRGDIRRKGMESCAF